MVSEPERTPRLASRREVVGFLAILAAFIVIRFPAVVHLPGCQDEQWFAAPGWTVLHEGIPRIPYLKTSRVESFFAGADRALFTLPPLQFYLQAPFHAIFPPGHAASRGPSFLAALLSLFFVWRLARRLSMDPFTVWSATALFAASRFLLFSAQSARPGMVCSLLGLIALDLTWTLTSEPKAARWRIAALGAACGFGMLAHPSAITYIAIVSGWLLLDHHSSLWRRFARLATVGLIAACIFALWLPLILRFPEEFRNQFFPNVLNRAMPGLPYRLLWPWDYLKHHYLLIGELAQPLQRGLFGLGLIVAAFLMVGSKRSAWRRISVIVLVHSYLVAICAGIHPVQEYWLVPGAYGLVLLVCAGHRAAHRLCLNQSRWQGILQGAISLTLLAVCVPGGGFTASLTYLRHWGSPEFHGTHFVESLLEDLPREGTFAADIPYVFPLYLSGRETVLADDPRLFYPAGVPRYDYLILGWHGEDQQFERSWRGELQRTYGQVGDPPRCGARLYVPAE